MQTTDIVTATRVDIPDLIPLLGLLFAQESEFIPNQKQQRSGLELLIGSPETGCIFLAKQSRRTVGMISLLFSVSTAEGGRVGQVEDFIVTPAQRNQGIGSLLLKHAIAHAEKMRLIRLTLLTDAENLAARALYARYGFDLSAMVTMRKRL